MATPAPYSYVGDELDLFRHATRWKRYLSDQLTPYISGDVLEVGAGVGGTTSYMVQTARSWTCLEPDPVLAERLGDVLAREPATVRFDVLVGTLRDVPSGRSYDAILYIDVLEHIADDRAELRRAAERLKPGGHLIVLAPAHQWLYSEFDHAIGHHRRYSRSTLTAVDPGLDLRASFYLDSLGMLASLANRLLLRRSLPTPSQIRFWDDWLVRGSRWVDPMLLHKVGKSVVVVWTRHA